MMFHNVCRLCSCTKDLVWVFDEKIADNMTEIIEVTCGVEIARTDTVTQMVCSTCCQVTIKMYQFRTKSIKNDKDLKAKCAGYNIAQLTNAASAQNNKPDPPAAKAVTPTLLPPPPPPHFTIKPITPITAISERYRFAHPSVKEVVKKNPNIKLPFSCLKSHVGAYITLLTDEVDEYYRERKVTDADIARLKAEAYEFAFGPKKAPVPRKRKKPSREEKNDGEFSPFNHSKRVRLSTESSDKTSVSSEGDVHLPGKENLKNAVNETPKSSNKASRNNNIKIRSVIPNDAKTSPPKTKTPEVTAKTSDAFFSSLLNSESSAKKTTSPAEEITLKSILQSQRKKIGLIEDDDDDIIDVDGPPSPAPSPTPSDKEAPPPPKRLERSQESDEAGTKTVPDEDFQLFTSRPFLKDGIRHIMINGEPVVISDSEDEDPQNQNGDDGATSEPIVFDLESRSSTTSKYSEADKTTFTEALQLAPRGAEGSNQPDLSLVALANKTHKLYTCRVCDSQHTSLKELKHHERRTHTKCPFCSKRFRSLANRDEHVSNTCSINRSPVKLKHVRLELTRVDEIEEIKKRYASAFEISTNEETDAEVTNEASGPTEKMPEGAEKARPEETQNEENRTEVDGDLKKPEVTVVKEAVQKPKNPGNGPVVCDAATATAITELEQFLNYAEIIPVKDKRTLGKNARERSARSEDVICISDEESEQQQITPNEKETVPQKIKKSPKQNQTQDCQTEFQVNLEGGEQTINVVNSELLNDINIHDNDFNVLKAILFKNWKRLKTRKEDKVNEIKTSLKDSPIVDGNSSRMKIFKNLRKYLHQYKIPIEVKYSPTVSVQYKPTTPSPPVRLSGMWSHLTPHQLKPHIFTPVTTTTPTPPKTTGYTVLNGQIGVGLKQVFSVPVTSGPRQTVISNSTPHQHQPKIPSGQDNNLTTTNLILSSNALSSSQPSLILSAAPTLTTTSSPFTNYIVVQNARVLPSPQVLPTPQVLPNLQQMPTPQVLPSLQQMPVPQVLPSLQQMPTPQVLPSLQQMPTPQVLPSLQQMPTPQVLPSLQPMPTPQVLPSLQPISTPQVLPSLEAPPSPQISPPSPPVLPSTQGPLPVIESVISAGQITGPEEPEPSMSTVAQLESITNSLMPTTPTDEVVTAISVMNDTQSTSAPTIVTETNDEIPQPPVQPAIRVRNLKELS